MKLYIFPRSPRAVKVLAVANYLGLRLDIQPVDYLKAEQHSPGFAAINPNRRMPVLDDDGFVLWESNAILQYLAQKEPENGLWPRDPRLQADVSRWQFWEVAHWEPAWEPIFNEKFKKLVLDSREGGRRTFGLAKAPGIPDAEQLALGERNAEEVLTLLDAHLIGRDWVSDAGLSIADFGLAAMLPGAQFLGYTLTNHPNVARWFAGVEALPGWREAQPERGPQRAPASA